MFLSVTYLHSTHVTIYHSCHLEVSQNGGTWKYTQIIHFYRIFHEINDQFWGTISWWGVESCEVSRCITWKPKKVAKWWSWVSHESVQNIGQFQCSCVHVYIYIYIPRYVDIHVYLNKYMFIHTYIYTYIHIYIYTYIHKYINTSIHLYIYTYIHIYIYT